MPLQCRNPRRTLGDTLRRKLPLLYIAAAAAFVSALVTRPAQAAELQAEAATHAPVVSTAQQ